MTITVQGSASPVLEDIDWMLTTGEHPLMIVHRVGRNATTIVRLAYRHGRKDIARQFNGLSAAEKYRHMKNKEKQK